MNWTRWASTLLSVVLAWVVLAVDLPLVHDHDAAGLYNEDCPLGRLAAPAPGTPMPDAIPSPGLPPVCEAPLPSRSVEPSSPSLVSYAPRAPPALV